MSRPAGSPLAKTVGLAMWVVFGPAAIALLPGTLLWRGALPIEGTSGRLLADMLVPFLNLPGASIVLALMVALSLYLATTFTFNTAREWATMRFGFAQTMWERWSAGASVAAERTSRRRSMAASANVLSCGHSANMNSAERKASEAEDAAAASRARLCLAVSSAG